MELGIEGERLKIRFIEVKYCGNSIRAILLVIAIRIVITHSIYCGMNILGVFELWSVDQLNDTSIYIRKNKVFPLTIKSCNSNFGDFCFFGCIGMFTINTLLQLYGRYINLYPNFLFWINIFLFSNFADVYQQSHLPLNAPNLRSECTSELTARLPNFSEHCTTQQRTK